MTVLRSTRPRNLRHGSVRRIRALAGVAFVFGVALLAGAIFSSPAGAAEPFLEFVEGLRDRGYLEIALDYLDDIEKRPETPDDIRAVIPFERAQTLLGNAASRRNLDERRAELSRAEQELDRFIAATPDHPLAGRANSSRAEILLRRGVVDLWDAEDTDDEARRQELVAHAQSSLQQARTNLATAEAQHKQEWKSFPTFIPESDRARRAAQEQAKGRYLEARLDLAKITYWEAHSYPLDSESRRKKLDEAVANFGAIAEESRGDLAGEYAVVWQGKCYEELGDARKAVGVYDRVLQSEDNQAAVAALKDVALNFRLICLNTDQLKDYAVAAEEGEQWFKDHRDRRTTDAGLGIQWETCRALGILGSDRTRSDSQRRADMSAALERARMVARFSAEHKSDAARLVQRLMDALDQKGGEARDFASAYAAALTKAEEAARLGDSYRSAQSRGDAAATADLQRNLRSTGEELARLVTRALRLRRESREPEQVAIARLQLAYANYLQGRYLDSAVVAEHQLRSDAGPFPDLARRAGELAMTALDAEMSGHQGEDNQAVWDELNAIANRILEQWPDSDNAQAAKMVVAQSAWRRGDWLVAADWWSRVSPGAPQSAAANISAGQAYWNRYVQASQPATIDRPPQEQLREWKRLAVERLEQGIQDRQKSLAPEAVTPDDLVHGKLTLAKIRNLDGVFHSRGGVVGSIELLTQSPHDVISAVAAPPDGRRSDDPSRASSAALAGAAYQQLLRAQIGAKDLDAARQARVQLERVAAGGDPQALTAIYVEFGRELQHELERLAAEGESERAATTRKGLEEFLTDLSERTDGQSFSSLLWTAETFAGLAEGARNPADAQRGFARSAAIYSRMLSRADEPGFLPDPDYRPVIQLHLASNLRQQQQFAEAEQALTSLLRSSPNAPDVQSEMAQLYQAWGAAEGGSTGRLKLEVAIRGQTTPIEIWGWSGAIQRLQREVVSRPSEMLRGLLVAARQHLAEAELQQSELADDATQRNRHLALARHAIYSYVRSTNAPTDEEYARFNALYGRVLAELGEPAQPLPRDASQLSELIAQVEDRDPRRADQTHADSPVAALQQPSSRTPVGLLAGLFGAGLLAALAIVMSALRRSSRRRRRLLEISRRSSQRAADSSG